MCTLYMYVFSERYLGDQRYSYSQDLSFTLRVGEEGARPSVTDLVIEGDGMKITLPLYYQVLVSNKKQILKYSIFFIRRLPDKCRAHVFEGFISSFVKSFLFKVKLCLNFFFSAELFFFYFGETFFW